MYTEDRTIIILLVRNRWAHMYMNVILPVE